MLKGMFCWTVAKLKLQSKKLYAFAWLLSDGKLLSAYSWMFNNKVHLYLKLKVSSQNDCQHVTFHHSFRCNFLLGISILLSYFPQSFILVILVVYLCSKWGYTVSMILTSCLPSLKGHCIVLDNLRIDKHTKEQLQWCKCLSFGILIVRVVIMSLSLTWSVSIISDVLWCEKTWFNLFISLQHR